MHPQGAPRASSHGNRFWLVPLGAREIEGENPVSVFGLDPVCVDFHRYGDRAIEPSGEPLATMQSRAVAVLDRLAAGNANGIALDLDVEVRFANAGQLGDQHDIVTLAKDVERRVGAGRTRTRAEPLAGAERVEGLLELVQGVERIGKIRCHEFILLLRNPQAPHRSGWPTRCVARVEVAEPKLLPGG